MNPPFIRFVLLLAVSMCFLIDSSEGDEPVFLRSRQLHDQIYDCMMQSPALQSTASFSVVTPASYTQDSAPFPVVYLLHGAGRTHLSLIESEAARRALLDAPFVTVMPKGEGGWWIDSPVVEDSRYETFVFEVIQVAQDQFNISDNPSSRGVTGWSMGGFGAMRIAERHPDEFSSAATIIGLLDFPNFDLPPDQNHSAPSVFGSTRDMQESFNPLPHAQAVKGMNLLLIAANQAFDFTMNENFHAKLQQLEIEHQYVVLDGGHTFSIVEESILRIVTFFREVLARRSCAASTQIYP
ncbi:MAG: alpha/beta hydrolase [Candidatus Hinthialibacter sp.]